MDCSKCHEPLLEEEYLCFFRKGDRDVSLIIKPEMVEIALNSGKVIIEDVPKELQENKKHQKQIACGNCHSHLGTPVPFGPGGCVLYAFGCKEIRLKGKEYGNKQKWWKIVSTFDTIEERTMETFFNTLNVKKLKIKKNNESMQSEIVFPCLNQLKHFEWLTVSHDKTPRQYQIEAYVEVLQQNLVAVIKTGAGKTLIASMFLAKMCSLNPKKMGLFIVDRVPLAFQQGEALRKDTHLRVLSLSGENKTAYKLKQLNNNCFDILVITAGAFYDLVAVKKRLSINSFCAVVLDECHHVTKAHKYCDVLKLFTSAKRELQPRILGLTASPCNAKNLSSAIIDLEKFFQSFPKDTKIFLPKLANTDHVVEEEKVMKTPDQDKFIQKCVEKFHDIETNIKMATGVLDLRNLEANLSNSFQVVGELRAIEEEYCGNPTLRSHVRNAMILMDAMEMCNLMGISSGVQILKQENDFNDICTEFCNNEDVSIRLQKLQDTVQSMDENSKILVFVSRRTIARDLAIKLRTMFPNMKVDKVVGHSGFDGMDWETEQKVILNKFKEGDCNLLVCTSVLEEGIDVAQCDLVVYFTGVQSLIKYIQARGRARKPGSRFIIYQEEGELSKNVNLKSEEENLHKALKRMNRVQDDDCGNLSQITQQIISSIEKDGEQLFFEQKKILFSKPGKSDFSFMVYVDQIAGVDSTKIRENLMENLEEIQEFELKRLERISADSDVHTYTENGITRSTLRYLVGVKCNDCNDLMERYARFCSIFQYRFEINGVRSCMWSHLKKDCLTITSENKSMESDEIQVKGFQLGHFVDKVSYVVGHSVEYDTTVSFKGESLVIKYFNEDSNNFEQIIITKTSLGSFLLLSIDKDITTLACYLAHGPRIEEVVGDKYKQLYASDENVIGKALGEYPALILKFQRDEYNDVVRNIEQSLPVPYFNVKLEEAVMEEYQTDDKKMDIAMDMDAIEWSLQNLKDSRKMIYQPQTLEMIRRFVVRHPDEKNIIEKVVQKCCIHSTVDYFCKFEHLFSREYETYREDFKDGKTTNNELLRLTTETEAITAETETTPKAITETEVTIAVTETTPKAITETEVTTAATETTLKAITSTETTTAVTETTSTATTETETTTAVTETTSTATTETEAITETTEATSEATTEAEAITETTEATSEATTETEAITETTEATSKATTETEAITETTEATSEATTETEAITETTEATSEATTEIEEATTSDASLLTEQTTTSKTREENLEEVIPEDHFLVKRAVVTPLRIITLPAVPVASNRILRMLADKYNVVVVSFKEEDLTKIRSPDVLKRTEECIENGIVIGGKRYHMFAESSSQLREHKAYFLEVSLEEIAQLRRKIIPRPEDFKCRAKYTARLGIYGTADKCVGQVDDKDINIIHDISTVDEKNRDIVTDGAGKISETKAKEISNILGLDEVPSAFQIRYSGTKGILVKTVDNDEDLDGKPIALRNSMIKFENEDKNLCITSTSKFNEFTMSRELITLLTSIPQLEGSISQTLLDYQEKTLQQFSEMFSDKTKAQEEMKLYMEPSDVNSLSSCSMEILDEKYWLSIFQAIYRLKTMELRKKTTIPVEKSCLIIGIPDPYGVLNEGEVFVQIKPPGGTKTKIIQDSILVFRNPCLHPGDIRTVSAVDKEELKDLFNVVVFPTKNCKRSLAASCSGGDLDGDQYGIIWDKNLVPPENLMVEPCDYADLANNKNKTKKNKDKKEPEDTDERKNPDNVTDQKVLAQYFTAFMSNDCLGRVAHKHLALCDIVDKGAREPVAMELAKSQAQAVDYPKTGIIPEVPEKAIELVNSYPDFMEKPVSETHVSKKILGILYRRCRSLTYEFGGNDLYGDPNLLMNRHLIVPGHENYVMDAQNVYLRYAHDVQSLMNKFELKEEADVILGQATIEWSAHLEADKGKATKVIKACYSAIVQKYRDIFFSDCSDNSSKYQKASAWYRVVNDDTNSENSKIKKNSGVIFRSFPWIVTDVLCSIRQENKEEQHGRLAINIGESALYNFKQSSKYLIFDTAKKMRKLKEVENALEKLHEDLKGAFIVSAYGSTSIYVNEPDSDIDICILPTNKAFESNIIPHAHKEDFKNLDAKQQQKHFLRFISLAIDNISSQKKEVFDATVPIIKCTFMEGDLNTECDISMNEVGYRKTLYIHHLFQNKPWFLPLFWVLVRWARISGIVKSTLNSDKLMDTAEFYALIIYVLDLPKMEQMVIKKTTEETSIETLDRKCNRFNLDEYFQLGKYIFDFFKKASALKGNIEIKWPAPGIEQTVVIDESIIRSISTIASQGFHALSATRDVDTMLKYFLATSNNRTELVKMLPLSLSFAIGKARSFHAARLSEVTGALVDIEIKEGKNNLLLTGRGSRLAIEKLQSEIRSLLESSKALVLGRLPQKGSRYFMEGSSFIMAKKNSDTATNLYYENSSSGYQLHHETCQRSVVYLNNDDEDEDEDDEEDFFWREKEEERLYEQIFNQLQKLSPTDNDDLIDSLEITCRLGAFYLVDIDCSLRDSQNTIQVQELQLGVEKGRRSRKFWQRSEFKPNLENWGLENYFEQREKPIEEFKTVPLSSLKGGKRLDVETVQNDIYKTKRTRSGIAAAFSPDLLKNNTKDSSAIKQLQEGYRSVLRRLNFKRGQSTSRTISPVWKASVNPSATFEVQVSMDENQTVTKVSERPLNWVHATILDGHKQHFNGNVRTNGDIRVLMSTQDIVKEESDLYNCVVPDGKAPFEVKDEKPRINVISNMTGRTNAKNFVSLIRNVRHSEVYTDGEVDVCILTGNVYFGDEMQLSKPFCELSVLFDPQLVVKSIYDNFSDDSLKRFVKHLFDISLSIKEELEVALKKSIEE